MKEYKVPRRKNLIAQHSSKSRENVIKYQLIIRNDYNYTINMFLYYTFCNEVEIVIYIVM